MTSDGGASDRARTEGGQDGTSANNHPDGRFVDASQDLPDASAFDLAMQQDGAADDAAGNVADATPATGDGASPVPDAASVDAATPGAEAGADGPVGNATDAGSAGADAAGCVARRCGHEIACGVAADGCGNSVTCDPCPDVGRVLRVPNVRHMVVDKARNLIYATVPASNSTYPNSVLVIASTPTTPKVMTVLPVGLDPNVLALSDDATRLWVGTDGDFAIQKITLGTGAPVVGPQYKLPAGANYPHPTRAGAMKVLHGSGDSVIVSVTDTATYVQGVVVIDDGVPRSAAIYTNPSCLAVGQGSDVFGADGRSTSFDFMRLSVAAQGVSRTLFPSVLTDFTEELVFDRDRVYSGSGDVIDVTNPSSPARLGKFPTWGSPRPLPADPTRALQVSLGQGDTAVLRMIDTSTFATKAMITVTGVSGYYMRDLDLLGGDTVAFIAAQSFGIDTPNQVVVARTSLLP